MSDEKLDRTEAEVPETKEAETREEKASKKLAGVNPVSLIRHERT